MNSLTPNPKPWLNDLLLFLAVPLVLLPLFLGALWFNGTLATEWPTVVVAIGFILVSGIPFLFWFAKASVQTAIDPASVLVHWHYSPDEWQAYVASELVRHPVNWATFLVGFQRVALVLGLVGVVALFGDVDFWVRTLGFCFILLVTMTPLVAGIYLGLPWLACRRIRTSPAAAIIGKAGLYLTQRATVWGLEQKALHSVRWVEGTPPSLEFAVKVNIRGSEQINYFYVPVPQGEEAAARQVLAYFASHPST